ncbi:unnamed protein product [Phytophthora fragariaefolia]|uniref:Unnamed protein product n=1 Tax=Phytophthora fragariaefolia TaxID=1490495 RepID=A0A9W7CZA3_9STRA|nr:unnamed protein product [Phytophthora fragariaefolia]
MRGPTSNRVGSRLLVRLFCWLYSGQKRIPRYLVHAGENTVVTVVIESGLSADTTDDNSSDELEVASSQANTLDETVTALRIDTSIMLSANTIMHIFQPDSEGVAEPLVSKEIVRASADGHVEATNGDLWGQERRGRRRRYETVGSGGSDGSDFSDDEPILRREYPSVVEGPNEEVAGMDTAFIEALGGNVTLESIDMDTLRSLEWSSPSSKFESVRAEYSQLSMDVATSIRELQDIAEPPFLLFSYFVPKSLWVT